MLRARVRARGGPIGRLDSGEITIYRDITQIPHDRSNQMFGHERSTEAGRYGPARHGGHRRHRHGRGEFGGVPFGGPFGPGWGSRGGWRKARRGDIRTAALLLLAEEPRNGYEIMQLVEERSDGVWRPSPGSVYPALAQLEDEGLIRSEEADGRKVLAITDEGRALLAERGEDR